MLIIKNEDVTIFSRWWKFKRRKLKKNNCINSYNDTKNDMDSDNKNKQKSKKCMNYNDENNKEKAMGSV